MILLDTNVLLWLFMGDKRLSLGAQNIIEHNPADCYVSIVSMWEIAIKRSLGELDLNMNMSEAVIDAGFSSLGLTYSHIDKYELLPFKHRDPFDHMLVTQALVENVPLLTSATFLGKYDSRIISAET